jgi:2TM domain
MEKQTAYQKAKARVEVKVGFYIHLVVFVVVNLLLTIINLSTSAYYSWAKWPLMGWGLALAIDALRVFVFPSGSAIKEQMIENELAKEIAEE